MKNLELMQKEARAEYAELVGMDEEAIGGAYGTFTDNLVAHVYKQAIEDAIASLPPQDTSTDNDEYERADRVAWNAYRGEANRNLQALLPTTNP